MLRTLTLQKLVCQTPEDWLPDGDEAKLVITVDGVVPTVLTKPGLKAGDTWDIGLPLAFTSNVRVRLYDEDNPGLFGVDPDDELGDVTITSALTNSGRARFTQDQADYTLHYTVTDPLGSVPGTGNLPTGVDNAALIAALATLTQSVNGLQGATGGLQSTTAGLQTQVGAVANQLGALTSTLTPIATLAQLVLLPVTVPAAALQAVLNAAGISLPGLPQPPQP